MTLGESFSTVLEGARRGAERDIATLYEDVNPALMRYLSSREPQEAEDLCSETWIRLARQLAGFEGGERQWWGLVFLVARRTLNDHWKRRRRRRTEPVSPVDLVEFAGGDDVEALGLEPIETAEAISFVTRTLGPDLADVVLLRVVAGLSVEEVAAAMSKRPGTVRVLQHRALRQLAARLEADTAPALQLGGAFGHQLIPAVDGPGGRAQ
jgi:RNA polymerase sigma-70 factor (ECF subfamily)